MKRLAGGGFSHAARRDLRPWRTSSQPSGEGYLCEMTPRVALLFPALTLAALPWVVGCARSDALADTAGGIVLDGRFGDWAQVPLLLGDPQDAPAGSVEILSVHATEDPAWLYLALEVGEPVNLQAMPGTLHLVLDTDADEGTGGSLFGLEGADLVLDLSEGSAGSASGHGAGFGLRPVDGGVLGARRTAYDAEVAGLPTWATTRFELRFARGGAPDGFARLGSAIRLKLAFTSQAARGDETDVATYTFATPAGPDPFTPSLTPLTTRADGAFRVAVWNVSEGSFRSPEAHARILAAVRPDVVLLDEVYEEISDAALAAFFAHPGLAELGTWRWVYSRAGGRQKTVVAVRDRGIRQAGSMERVTYGPGALDSLRALLPPTAHPMLDVEARVNMSATGAWVDVEGTEVLFVPLDLQSAGYLGSPQDLLREVQARTLHRHIVAELAGAGNRAPVVVGGDFNIVGSDAPVRILAEGLDVDGSDLALAGPRRLGEPSLFTWHDPRRGPFAPGRLDLVLHAGAALEDVGGFVFDTGDLTDAQLADLGLERGMSAATSDHLVVVVDLRVR